MKKTKSILLSLFLVLLLVLSMLLPSPAATTSASAAIEVTPTVRIPVTIQSIPGFETPSWLLDNTGRTWVRPLPLNTYITFGLPQPRSHILFQWMASGNYDYNTIQYGGPSAYDIQISSNSTDGTNGEWVTVVDEQNNSVAARAHEIKAENIRWVRFRVTAGASSIDEIDIHDLSLVAPGGAADTWGFIGDSITADSYWRDIATGKAFNQYVNEAVPERYPGMINLGIGGQNAQHLRDRLQHTIDLNTGVHFWAIGIGTNASGSAAQYEGYLRDIINTLIDNGKQPIIALIPFSRNAARDDSRIVEYNAVVDLLTREYGLPIGPDLYTAFKEHSEPPDNPNSYYRDDLHPNNRGKEVLNRLWAEVASTLTLGGEDGGNGTTPTDPSPTEPPLTPTDGRFIVDGTRILSPDGTEFLLKGVNINGPGWCFPRDTLQDVGLMIDAWQFNSVRLCIATKWLQAYGNEDLDAIINAFTSRGIVVMLENHDYTGIYPTDESYYHPWDDQPNYRVYINTLFDFKAWWVDIAGRYKDDPYVWFNVMNEPGPHSRPPTWLNAEQSAGLWYTIHDELIDAIRGTGAENIIVLDEHNWGQGNGYRGGASSYDSAVIRMGPLLNQKYDNLVYSLHVYDSWADGFDRFNAYFRDARERGLCMIIGEYGVMRDNATQENAVRNMFNSAIPNSVGRMYWAWDDNNLPMTTSGRGWQIDRTDGTMPSNLTWVGRLIWLDNRGLLRAPIETAPPIPFTDVSVDDWFCEYVMYAYENGLMQGTSTTTFAPNSPVTRGMVVTVLHRFAMQNGMENGEWRKDNENGGGNIFQFVDVLEDAYYYDAVSWAAENGIVQGYDAYDGGRFGPEDNVTREQLATIIYNYARFCGHSLQGEPENSLSFSDAAEVSDWALDGAIYCTKNGIITGKPGNLFDPKGNASRAEFATMLTRLADSM